MVKLVVALFFLGLNGYVYWYMGNDEVIPARTSFAEFPNVLGDWKCDERDVLEPEILNNLKLTDYLSCNFVNAKEHTGVHVYISYHERQTRDRNTGEVAAIHPPEHCLPGSGWDVIDSKVVPLDLGIPGEAKRFVIAKGTQRALVYFWYQSNGRVVARNHHKIFWMFLDRTMRARTDGSLVRFTVPIQIDQDEQAAEASFKALAAEVSPLLPAYIPN